MSGRSGWRGSARIGFLGLALCAVLPLAAFRPAAAGSGFIIGHAPPAVAPAGQDLTLSAIVASTCTIAHCGEIRLVAVYRVPGGTRFAVTTLPASKAQVGEVTLPGVEIRVPSIVYKLAAYQERCFFMSCPTASTETGWYTVMVRTM